MRLTVNDLRFFQFMQCRIPRPSPAILFKYPNGCIPSGPNEPESLCELSFKILAILAENAARFYSSHYAQGFIFDWHLRSSLN